MRLPHALCHDQPDLYRFDARVLDSRPGAVRLDRSAFFPGGGGQLPDRGLLRWSEGESEVTRIEAAADGSAWHWLADPDAAPDGAVEGVVDRAFRDLMRQLHTALHIVNALVYRDFDGALVTGAQMAADGTGRADFDLPDADNDRLRALEPEINAVIRRDLAVSAYHVPVAEAQAEPGLLRSRSVAPPPSPDGMVRIVEIAGLDRQACGGTHLASTGRSRPVRILKIDNKGRHFRRVRIGLA